MDKLQVKKPDAKVIKRMHDYAERNGKVKTWVYNKCLEIGIGWLEKEEYENKD
ncbi:MAG: hypothetical protein ACLFQA_00295 [Bacteroidales bacterium]